MSEASKAVFLSYASQDAEAVKRIAEALRAAGVEVWFDAEGGLEHGDEWDAKIRKQVKECVLFIAVISANTQAREEGYFRIEWDMAADRARGIASGVAFILPVIIDGTREPEALVPDRFRSVQWTKLPGGNVPPDVLARFLKLWSHRTGALKYAAVQELEAGRPRPAERGGGTPSPIKLYALAAVAVLVLGAVLFFALRPRRSPEEIAKLIAQAQTIGAEVSAKAAAAAPVSEARQLVAKAYPLIHGLDATREDFALAEEYCQRALKLDPDDGEVWAASSQVNSAFSYRGWDTSPARKEQTRVAAERAMRLAPGSANARLAQAGAWATFNINRDEREKLLREIVRDDPGNQEALRFLAVTVLVKPNGLEECLALNERAAALPGGDALALFNNARYLWTRGRPADGYATLQRALAQRTFTSGLVLKMAMELTWRGDFGAAADTLGQIPQSALQEDRANYHAGLLHYYQGDAAAALEIWQAFPRDYYMDFIYEGPKGLFLGLADELDHREAAAKIEWRAALQLVEKKIAAAPSNPTPYYCQAFLLACLGEKAAAGEALRTHEQLAGIKYTPEQPMTLNLAKVYVRLGRLDEVFAYPPSGSRAILRISPDFAALRADPRFRQLMEPAAAPPKSAEEKPAVAPVADTKSVAVLAFANLSDDKANEYFSDGISEELLNVLAKVPKLKVAARTSSFYFKGRNEPISEIAQKLGVAYVVEGSVRKAGNKVRIAAQLIKAADGFPVWSETYDRELQDIFAVQDEIAKNILGVVKGSLLGEVELEHTTTTKPEAYALFLRAQGQLAARGEVSMFEAERLFKAALAIDPDYVPALVGLARTQSLLPVYGNITGAKALTLAAEAKQAAEHALRLEPGNAGALTVHGSVMAMAEWRWADGEVELLRARELAPNDPWVANLTGDYFLFTANVPAALAAKRKWRELDPLSATSHWDLGYASLLARDYDQAIQCGEQARKLSPTNLNPPSVIALAAGRAGRFDLMHQALATSRRDVHENEGLHLLLEADCAILEKRPDEAHRFLMQAERLAAKDEASPAYIGYLHLLLGESDQAAVWLRQAYDGHDVALAWAMNIDFADIAADPKTRPLLDLPGLKELWEIRQRNARAATKQL